MNGTIPAKPPRGARIPQPSKTVQVMSDGEIAEKKNIDLRLTRQAEHYAQVVSHFLSVKNSKHIARAMDAHFQRLSKYHNMMLGISTEEEGNDDV